MSCLKNYFSERKLGTKMEFTVNSYSSQLYAKHQKSITDEVTFSKDKSGLLTNNRRGFRGRKRSWEDVELSQIDNFSHPCEHRPISQKLCCRVPIYYAIVVTWLTAH